MENGDIAIRIGGNKISEVSGQCWRVFVLPPAGLVRHFLPFATTRKFSFPFRSINTRRIERVVAKASSKSFGCHKRVNCSTFRNGVSSQLKALNWSADDIAKC